MPTYVYQCQSCGYVFEEFQGINEEPLKICPKCGGNIRRKFSGNIGLIFRGSGFYITDYKKSSSTSDSSNGSKSETKTEKSGK